METDLVSSLIDGEQWEIVALVIFWEMEYIVSICVSSGPRLRNVLYPLHGWNVWSYFE